jgi:dihydropteroate synthase
MKIWHCGRFLLPLGAKTYVMGIVNVTPDSFSGDGVFDLSRAVDQALQMVDDGADILDIGGESTRPGAAKVDANEELRRVVPLIEKLAPQLKTPLSVDTTKALVARAALETGADIINDISGATFDEQMLPTVADSDCGLILMHLRGTPQTMQWSQAAVSSQRSAGGRRQEAENVISEILDFWQSRVQAAQNAGIAHERIALDAGFGFGKSLDENLEILRRGRELAAFGFPTLSATSRKSTIGKILDNAPVEERLFGTAATVALAIANGAGIVRVHDVKEMAQVAQMADAVVRTTALAGMSTDKSEAC